MMGNLFIFHLPTCRLSVKVKKVKQYSKFEIFAYNHIWKLSISSKIYIKAEAKILKKKLKKKIHGYNLYMSARAFK